MARLFEQIETPEPGWETRKLKRVRHLGLDPEWLVQLARLSDGLQVQHQHPSLHVAWVRACEQAYASNLRLDHPDGEVSGQS